MELTPKQKAKLDKVAHIMEGGELAIAKYILDLEDKLESSVEQIKRELPTLDEIIESVAVEDGIDGEDYVLTDDDKQDIAQIATGLVDLEKIAEESAKKIVVPTVEKVIEKTEVIREIPNEIDIMPAINEAEGRLKKAIEKYVEDLFELFKEDTEQAQNGYTDEVKTLQNRTQLLLQIATQRTNTTTTGGGGGPSTDAWNLTGNSGTTAGTNFVGTTDDEDFVFKTNSIERLRLKSFGASDITELRIGTSTTNSGRIYFRDGETEFYRIDLEKSGSAMNATESMEATGIATKLVNVVGSTDGFYDISASTATRILIGKPIRFMNSSNYVGLKTSSTTPDDTDYSLPANDANRSGNGITSNQSGVLSFDYFLRSLGTYVADSTSVSNTTSETLFDITQNILSVDINLIGRTYIVFATGRISTTGSPTLTFKLKGGTSSATTLWDSGAQTIGAGVTDRPFQFVWVVTTRTTGGTGEVHTAPVQARVDARTSNNARQKATVDLTLLTEIGLSATWSAASSSNVVTLDTFLVIDANKR